MLAFAMEISANGTSDSTTTARFMGTLRLLDASPVMTRKVWACAVGTVVTVTATPSRAAFRTLSIFM